PRLEDHPARSEIRAQGEHALDVLEAGLLALGGVEAVTQRTTEGGQFEVVRPQQVTELAPAGLGEGPRRQIAHGVHLHAEHAEALDFLEGAPQGQAQRFQMNTDLESTHRHQNGHSWGSGGGACVKWWKGRTSSRNTGPGSATVPHLGLRTRKCRRYS